MSNSYIFFENILRDIGSTNKFDTDFLRQVKQNIVTIYKEVVNNNIFEEIKIFEKEYNTICILSNFVKTNDLEGLKNIINKNIYLFNIIQDFIIIPYDIILDAIDRKSSFEFIVYCIDLYDDLDYYYDSTLTPIYFAVKNNNFEIANVLLERGVDINLLNIYQGNILSFLLVDFINKENLKYIIDKNVDINYNLYCNNVDSLLSFSDKKESELNICNYFQSKWTNKKVNGVTITCFDYIIYEGLINGKIELLNLLEDIIQYKNFDLNKINEVSIELIIINKKNKIIEDIIRYKRNFISYEFCNTIMKNAILYNNTECLILILKVVIYFKEYDIKKLYNGKTTMSIFIEKSVDDEGIYNMLFNNGAFIDMKYLRNGKNKSSSFIVKNKGLIKSIIRNGFYIVRKNKLVLINTPLIYFIKNYNNDLVEKLLEDGASIEETDENGMTPIFYTIKTNNRKLFKLIIEKYNPNVNKKNKLGQTPLIVAQQLEKNKDNNREVYISLLENYIKNNEVLQDKKENNEAILLNSLQEKNNDISKMVLKDNNDIDINNSGLLKSNNVYNGFKYMNNEITNITKVYTPLIYAQYLRYALYINNLQYYIGNQNTYNLYKESFNVNSEKKFDGIIAENINNGDYTKTEIINSKNNLNISQRESNILLLNSIKQKDYNSLKKLLMDNKDIDVNKHYFNGKTIMSNLINNIVNDEELFNMLFERGGYLDYDYISGNCNKYSSLIERNPGLLKSIIHNGIIYMNHDNKKIKKIDVPLIYLIKTGKLKIVESLLENGAPVEETDNKGFTPIFYSIKCTRKNIFDLLLKKYHADVTKKNKIGQTPLMYAIFLKKEKKNNLDYFINSLSEMDKDNSKTLLSSLLKQKDYNSLKKVILENKDIDINKHINGKTVITTLIDNIVNDEELFNILFERGGYFDYDYVSSNCNKYSSLIERNPGLLKSIIHNGIIYMNHDNKKIKKIDVPLIYLIKTGKLKIVESLLENGAPVEETDNKGFTPIFYSIKCTRKNIFDLLLKKYHANITKKNKMSQTPLMYAKFLEKEKIMNLDYFINSLNEMEKGDIEKFLSNYLKQKDYNSLKKIIIENKDIDVNKHINGKTLMNTLIDNNVDDEELFNMLFERGGYFNYDYISSDCNKYSSLIENNPGLLKSIIHNGIIYMSHDNTEVKKIDIPLIYFIKSGKVKIVESLLENGALVEETDNEEFTPIFHTIKGFRKDLFDILLNKYHADITKRNKMGQTPLMYAEYLEKKKKINLNYFINSLNEMEKDNIEILLSNLLKQKNYSSLKKLLIDNKDFNINKYINGKTLISILVDNMVDDEELFNIIFNKGSYLDYNYVTSSNNLFVSLVGNNPGLLKSIIRNGLIYMNYQKNEIMKINTPLVFSIKSGRLKVAENFLKLGASVNEVDEEGYTPIFYSIRNNGKDLFNLLLDKYHADITKKNKNGQTPLMYAEFLNSSKNKSFQFYISELKKHDNHMNINSNIKIAVNDNNSKKNNTMTIQLICAIKEGNFTKAKNILFNNKIDVNFENSKYEAPLIALINNGQAINGEILKKLLELGADLCKNYNGTIPLIHAIKKKRIFYIKIMMSHSSININQKYNGNLLIDILLENGINDEEIFNFLFKKGTYLDTKYFSEKKYYNLIIKNPGLIKSIIRMGFMVRRKIDLVNRPIKQPIIFFIKCCKNELVQLLLEYGGSVNEIDNEGTTPILQSIKSGNIKIFKLLLEKYHPDTSIKNKLGQTPLDYARNLKKSSNRGHEVLRKEFISTLENYNKKMLNLPSATVKTSSSTAMKANLLVEEMINEINNLNSSNSTSSKTISTTINLSSNTVETSYSTAMKTNLSVEEMVNKIKNLNTINPTSSKTIPTPINKKLKKIKEKQLIQEKPKNLDEVNDNKENIEYYLYNGIMNNSNNEDEAALILNDEEWNENEEKNISAILDETLKIYDYFDEDNLN